jgi:lipopolysaccharide export LptBFGC system permease protein LptF
MENKNKMADNTDAQEKMKEKKKSLLNFYGFLDNSKLKQLLNNATQVNKDTERDIDKTIYGIVLYQTGKNKMEDHYILEYYRRLSRKASLSCAHALTPYS